MLKAVAILEVMWDWRAMTSGAGYAQAPPYFRINPENFTGSRLYEWLGHHSLMVTDACRELVSSASEKGTPDEDWLSENVLSLQPFELLIVCGKVAQATYHKADAGHARIVEVPHPAARLWTTPALHQVQHIIQCETGDWKIKFDRAGEHGIITRRMKERKCPRL